MKARFIAAAAVVLIAVAPAALGKFGVSLLNDIGIGALVALGLVMLTGVGGATSFGQAAFVGIAAYATAWLTSVQGMSPWIGLAFALLLTGVAALAIGALTLRLGGHFLPLSTIAWGLSIALLFGNVEALGRHTGLSNIPALNAVRLLAGRPARGVLPDLGARGPGGAVLPQRAAVAPRPRHPQPARRRDPARERRRRCVSRAA
jgi:ABC-type branched-subunit amino acid transport system permease subunit